MGASLLALAKFMYYCSCKPCKARKKKKISQLYASRCLVTLFVTLQEQPSQPLPAWSKFWHVDSWVKTYATSRNLCADRLAENLSPFFISVHL